MKAAALKSYGAKGQDVVDKNYAAIDRGGEYKKFEMKAEWAHSAQRDACLSKNLADDAEKQDNAPAFVKELVRPINAQAGHLLKVSDFVKHGTVDGSWEVGTAAYEKRGVEAFVPAWNKDRSNLFACQSKNCIQCNQCAYICPHAAIRPFVLTDEELAGFELDTLEMKAPAAMKGMHFVIEPSVLDCLGCGRSNLFAWLVQELRRHLQIQKKQRKLTLEQLFCKEQLNS